MSEEPKINEILVEHAKIIEIEEVDPELRLIDKVIQDYAPEIAYLYQIREDESEEQQIKTGRLHENRILGIVLKFFLEGKKEITTAEVELEYKRYFKEIARSTTSTYMNMLKKESTLYSKRDGRIAYYTFYKDPPIGLKPFWFTRIFCIVPAYFHRAMIFSKLYINAEKYAQQYINEYNPENKDILIRNFKFITGLIILKIFKNRSSKCADCQFSKREVYNKLEEIIGVAIKDRSTELSTEILVDLVEKYSEIPTFDGIDISENSLKGNIVNEIARKADIYKKDFDFQIMVSSRRINLRLKHIKVLEEENGNL